MAQTMTAMAPRASALAQFRLDGHVAFVSGAAGHLGRATVQALAQAGAQLIVNGRDDERLANFENELTAARYSVARAAFGIGDIEASRRFFAGFERLDILVNNAISMTPKPFAVLDASDFEQTYRISVTASFEAVRSALAALRAGVAAAREASVVNIASTNATVSPDKRLYSSPKQASPFHYGPAKAALLQLTRHLAAELGPGAYSRERPGPRAVSARRSGGERPGFRTAPGKPQHARPYRRGLRNRRPAPIPGLAGLQLRHRLRPGRRWRLDGLVS
jgi:NAD(P)-dependent dehydrogenase (short-subunit alcohol dehydrogenase family)